LFGGAFGGLRLLGCDCSKLNLNSIIIGEPVIHLAMFEPLVAYTQYFALLLRAVVGLTLVLHGYPKLKSPKMAVEWMRAVGVPATAVWLAIFLEFFGGLSLLIGFLVPLVAFFAALEFALIVVVKKSKMGGKYVRMDQGASYEIDVTYLLLSLTILVLGAGALSLDALLGI
jgi:putative oxidoreductase